MTKTVWHLCSNRWNSAVTEFAVKSAIALKSQGWKSVMTGLDGKACHERSSRAGVETYPVKGFGFKDLFKIFSLYRNMKPEVVMVYGGPETFLARFFKWSKVIRFRGLDRDFTNPPSPRSYRFSQGFLDAVVSPSSQMTDKFKFLEPNIDTVRLGIDSDKFYFKPFNNADARPTLVILGRLDPVKGHGGFFLWFRLLLRQWPEGTPKPFLKVVGEPANIPVEHLRGFAEDVNLVEGEDWELIDQRVDDLADLMSSSHLGVISSQGSEVICRVAQEFLMCGVPIFVSGVGSLEDCLYDDLAGVSYKGMPGNEAVDLLMKSLLYSFAETQEQRKERAFRSYSLFSIESMGESLDRVLDETRSLTQLKVILNECEESGRS